MRAPSASGKKSSQVSRRIPRTIPKHLHDGGGDAYGGGGGDLPQPSYCWLP
jgi:hypothetical protein